MPDTLAKAPPVAHVLLLASAVAGTLLAGKYMAARKVSAGERLADALLHTARLADAARELPDRSEMALSACALYMVDLAYHASEGLSLASGADDPIGFTRTETHPYTRAVATVLTEANAPDHILTFAMNIPDVGEVRGTRRVGGLHLVGLSPSRPAPDTVQFTLPGGYSAQVETEFEHTENLVSKHARLFGALTLRDNDGNAGRLYVGHDGVIAGTMTRDNRVIGRFDGKIDQEARFSPYHLEAKS